MEHRAARQRRVRLAMEDVLMCGHRAPTIHTLPAGMDEASKQLLHMTRVCQAAAPGQVSTAGGLYAREGVVNLKPCFAPLRDSAVGSRSHSGVKAGLGTTN